MDQTSESDLLIMFFWCEIGFSSFTFFLEDGKEDLEAMSCIIIQSVNFQYYEYCDRLQFSSEGAYSEISHFVNFAAPHISMIQSWEYCDRLQLFVKMFTQNFAM